jgi:hypothetical protein
MEAADTDTMIKLLDKALSSNADEVKSILQSLLVTTALVHADDKIAPGPLLKILEEFNLMKKTMVDMGNHIQRLEHTLDEMKSRIRSPDSDFPTRKTPWYDDYKTKWEDEDDWTNTIKRRMKERALLKSSSSIVHDEDTSRYTALKSAMAKFAAKMKD